jgi:hypothetical protein
MSTLDYYGAAICLSVIALHSEKVPLGVLWSLGFCLLGSPVCCLYVANRCFTKSIVLREGDLGAKNSDNSE